MAAGRRPQLVVLGGLPGVGKTTLGRAVADALGATFLRIDAVEAAVARSGLEVGDAPAGYLVAGAVASDQLRSGRPVVADAVNNVEIARVGWREIAAESEADVHFVEVICSDRVEHRRRVESRVPDLSGHTVPTWAEVESRTWEPLREEFLTVDNLGRLQPHVDDVLAWVRRLNRGG